MAGNIFYYLLSKSKWCSPWFGKLDMDMGYEAMRETFFEAEWLQHVLDFFYWQFKQSNKDNTEFDNFGDYFKFWRGRLKGVRPISEVSVIAHFCDNLPLNLHSYVFQFEINDLDDLQTLISQYSRRELRWNEMHKVESFENRRAAIAKMESKKKTPIPAITYKSAASAANDMKENPPAAAAGATKPRTFPFQKRAIPQPVRVTHEEPTDNKPAEN